MRRVDWRGDIKNWGLLLRILCESDNNYLESHPNTFSNSNSFFRRLKALQEENERNKAIQLSHLATQINLSDSNAYLKLVALCTALFNPTLRQKIEKFWHSQELATYISYIFIQGDYFRANNKEKNTRPSEVFSQQMLNESVFFATNCDSEEIVYSKPEAAKNILMLMHDKIERDPAIKKLFDAYYTDYSKALIKTTEIQIALEITPNMLGYNPSHYNNTVTGQVINQAPQL